MLSLVLTAVLCTTLQGATTEPADPQTDPRIGERLVSALGGESWQIGLRTLDPKIMPFGLEEDEDGKDIKVAGRARYKPHTKEDPPELKKRLRMKSKREGGRACMLAERAASGDVSTQMRVAMDATKGLTDGVSCAFYELRLEPVADGEPICLRAEAVWNEAIDGFTARASENGVPVGISMDFPGERELFLAVSRFGGTVELSVTSPLSYDTYELYSSGGGDGLFESFFGGFGVDGLDKGGSMYFAEPFISGDPDDVDLTPEEELLAFQLWSAAELSGLAEFFADPDVGQANIQQAGFYIAGAASMFAQARTSLDDLIADGTVTGKRAKLLSMTVKKGLKKTESGEALATKLIDKGKLDQPNGKLEKFGERGRNFGQMGTGQVYGYSSGGISKFYDSVVF